MYVQKIEQEKVAKERGETKDNRSFIAKYVIILHRLFFFLNQLKLTVAGFPPLTVDVHTAASPRFYDVWSQ